MSVRTPSYLPDRGSLYASVYMAYLGGVTLLKGGHPDPHGAIRRGVEVLSHRMRMLGRDLCDHHHSQ